MANLSATYFALRGAENFFGLVLWLAGIGHFCVLIASFQVPSRLHWREDLKQLTPFNRKLMWVYGGFTVFTIVAFGTLTLALHAELLRGERADRVFAAALGIADRPAAELQAEVKRVKDRIRARLRRAARR